MAIKHRFGLHRFGQGTLLGVYGWLVLSLLAYPSSVTLRKHLLFLNEESFCIRGDRRVFYNRNSYTGLNS